MKTMKVALLATAALAAVSVSARADDTAALKAELEALNARVAQLEAAPAVPTGYSLLTIAENEASTFPGLDDQVSDVNGYGKKATVIGILPTADVPASTTIEWSGYVRAAIVYSKTQGSSKDTNVFTRGQLKVVGKTDTAVGEVGVRIQIRANAEGYGDENVIMNEGWGWWAMTPELTLAGGYTGTLGNIGYGVDGACNCYYTDNSDAFDINPGDTTQMRLSYASGPLSMAIALEDATGHVGGAVLNGDPMSGGPDDLGVAAEIKYSGDAVSGEISGVWHNNSAIIAGFNNQDPYQIGAGLGFALGDMANLSIGAAYGRVYTGDNYWDISALASANLSDSVHAEIGVAHKDYESGAAFNDVTAALAGIYYDPVAQLTIGLEGEYSNPRGSNNNTASVDLVTVFRF
jgi:hypothetical protein